MKFKNLNILIISPNYWGTMFVSKHWYAIELAKRGNTIYFLQPPVTNTKFKITHLEEFGNLFLISGGTLKRGERFLPHFLNTLLDKLDAFYLKRKCNIQFDLIWDFFGNRLLFLEAFNAKKIIFHPVDLVEDKAQFIIAEKAVAIFSVAEIILEKFNSLKTSRFFINHGLNNHFANIAKSRLKKEEFKPIKKVKKVGFVGNLLKSDLAFETIQSIVKSHSEIVFYFIGSYEITNSNLGGRHNLSTTSFINFLKTQRNVHLLGPLPPEVIPLKLIDYDLLMMFYDVFSGSNQGANSHKLLEYLSIGKVIVSNHVATYKEHLDILNMPSNINPNSDYTALFKDAIENIYKYSIPEKQTKRIQLALSNTYEKQLEKIEYYLAEC